MDNQNNDYDFPVGDDLYDVTDNGGGFNDDDFLIDSSIETGFSNPMFDEINRNLNNRVNNNINGENNDNNNNNNGNRNRTQMKHKSVVVCYIIWFFGGLIGLHRLYLGQIELFVLYFITLASCGIQWIVDLFLIPQMVKEYNFIVDLVNEYDAEDLYTDTVRRALDPLSRNKYNATKNLPYIKQVMPIKDEDKLIPTNHD